MFRLTEFYEKIEYIVVAFTLAIALYLIIAGSVTVFLESSETATETISERSHNHLVLEDLLNAEKDTPRAVFTSDFILDEDNIDFREVNGEEHCYIEQVSGLDGERSGFGFIEQGVPSGEISGSEIFDRCARTELSGTDPSSRVLLKDGESSYLPGVVVYEIS